MLIDEVTIKVNAGNGGKGAVAFNKNLMSLGPTGASGGKGGSVYFEGVSDLNALSQFRYKKNIDAENGAGGGKQFRDGPDGKDLIIKIPVGTVIHKISDLKLSLERTRDLADAREILKIGDKILITKGGIGGKGNFHFRSSTNTTPKQFQAGLPGEHITVKLELKLIADVGLIGLPNAGKSSLLNELTKAQSKVANYPFTTLEPNLGAYYELILADIPGLIEGASSGKGLGIKFLRHIERTKVLFHLISAESENPVKDYKIIRKELETYSEGLLKKPEYVFLSKSDMVTAEDLKKKITALKKINPSTLLRIDGERSRTINKNAFPISIHDWESLKKVKEILNEIKSKK